MIKFKKKDATYDKDLHSYNISEDAYWNNLPSSLTKKTVDMVHTYDDEYVAAALTWAHENKPFKKWGSVDIALPSRTASVSYVKKHEPSVIINTEYVSDTAMNNALNAILIRGDDKKSDA